MMMTKPDLTATKDPAFLCIMAAESAIRGSRFRPQAARSRYGSKQKHESAQKKDGPEFEGPSCNDVGFSVILFRRDPQFLQAFPDVDVGRPDEFPVVLPVLQVMGDPACSPGNRKEWHKELRFDAQHPVGKSRIEIPSESRFCKTFCISPMPSSFGTRSSISTGLLSFTLSIRFCTSCLVKSSAIWLLITSVKCVAIIEGGSTTV